MEEEASALRGSQHPTLALNSTRSGLAARRCRGRAQQSTAWHAAQQSARDSRLRRYGSAGRPCLCSTATAQRQTTRTASNEATPRAHACMTATPWASGSTRSDRRFQSSIACGAATLARPATLSPSASRIFNGSARGLHHALARRRGEGEASSRLAPSCARPSQRCRCPSRRESGATGTAAASGRRCATAEHARKCLPRAPRASVTCMVTPGPPGHRQGCGLRWPGVALCSNV